MNQDTQKNTLKDFNEFVSKPTFEKTSRDLKEAVDSLATYTDAAKSLLADNACPTMALTQFYNLLYAVGDRAKDIAHQAGEARRKLMEAENGSR